MLPPKSNKNNIRIINLILFVVLIINLLLNYLYRHQLYQLGEEIIAEFQLSQNHLLTLFFLIPTILIDPSLIIVISFTLIILIRRKSSSFATVIWILLNAFLACLLKAYYSDPRPFWTSQSIQSIGLYCPVQYGNPSGHSWFSVTVGFGFLVDKFGPGLNNKNIYLSFLLIILVPMSRMYLGAHSLNQVIQGVCLGLLMVYFYKFGGLKQKISEYLNNFNCPGHKWKKLTFLLHLSYIVPFIINYYDEQSVQKQQINKSWSKNIMQECQHTPSPNELNFTMLMLNSLILNFSTGIALGYEQITLSQKGMAYLRGNWLINQQRYTLFCGYLRFVIIELGLLIVAFLPLGVVIYLLGWNDLLILVGGNVSVLMAGYLYTSKTFKILFDKEVIRQEIL